MNTYKLLKWLLVLGLLILLVLYLGNLLMLLLISFILYSILLPLKENLQTKLKVKSNTLSSVIALFFPSLVFLIILMYVFPVIITQLNSLTYLNYKDVFMNITIQFPFLDNLIEHLGGKKYILKSLEDTMLQIINFNLIAEWSSILLNNFSKILMHLLIVFFITFHLLKDDSLIVNILNAFVDDNIEKDMGEIVMHIKSILGRYFRGVLIDSSIVIFVNSVTLSLLGVKNGVLIGILSGILNIIPYVGPLITLLIGLFLGVSANILEGHYEYIGSTVLKIVITLLTVNVLDGVIIQPYIFSNVLKAHPLEIFLVIISAGMIGGVIWMMFIIPIYVIIKVVAKEFYTYLQKNKNA
ncbi:MAG TPA: AI-2E family transporter [Bacteroidia bacterium]|nr:AI-2E family transporter [Bacteroidia bacterium]